MGNQVAKAVSGCISATGVSENPVYTATNDYELVIRASKELEHIMVTCFNARGKGLHEYADSVQHLLSPDLQRSLHYLATIRNKLVHEYGFNSIPDRVKFISKFQESQRELGVILARHGQRPPPQSDFCKVM